MISNLMIGTRKPTRETDCLSYCIVLIFSTVKNLNAVGATLPLGGSDS